MSFLLSRKYLISAAFVLAASAAIPLGYGFEFETVWAAEPVTAIESPVIEESVQPVSTVDSSEVATGPEIPVPDVPLVDPELECIAKVVHHEAANQSRRGQMAVAQIILNRVKSGRFADTPCKVANQRGQFFNTHAYNPSRDGRWDMAVNVAREVRDGAADDVVPGAYFYHAAYQPPNGFFRSRQRITTLGDHIFYR